MKSQLLQACTLLMIGAISCGSSAADPAPSNQHSLKEIGVNALLTTAVLGGIQKRIRDGKLDQAMELIDAEYLRLLPQLREFDAELMREPTFRKLRDRTVKNLQTRWLKEPPMYLDEQSAEYLERTCATIPECPKGRVHPLKELPPLPPAE
jgi:hypothetical protein